MIDNSKSGFSSVIIITAIAIITTSVFITQKITNYVQIVGSRAQQTQPTVEPLPTASLPYYSCGYSFKSSVKQCIAFDNNNSRKCTRYQSPDIAQEDLTKWGTSNNKTLADPSKKAPNSDFTKWTIGPDDISITYSTGDLIGPTGPVPTFSEKIAGYNNGELASIKLFYDQDKFKINNKHIYQCKNTWRDANPEFSSCQDNNPAFDTISGLPIACGQTIDYGWDVVKCKPLDILFVVDTSTSMGVFPGASGSPRIKDIKDRLKLFQASVEQYLKDAVNPSTRISVIQFNKQENTKVIVPFETLSLTSDKKLNPNSKLAKLISNNDIYFKQENTNPKLCLCDNNNTSPNDRNCIRDRCIRQTAGINYVIGSAPDNYLGFELSEGTCIECALDKAKQMFTQLPTIDNDPYRQKIVVMITDAQSNTLNNTSAGYTAGINSANRLKADNVILSVIGVGQDEADLGNVAGGIAFDYMKKLATHNYAFLDIASPSTSYWDYIFDLDLCTKITTLTPTPTVILTPTSVPNPTIPLDACDLDIGLVIDNSYSIDHNVNKIQNALVRFVEGLAGSRARISLVIYSDDAKIIQPLTSDYQAVKEGIWSFDLLQKGTNLADAITLSRSTFDTSKNNPKIMIIATDGTPTIPDNITGFQKALEQAQITKSSPYNIRIMAMMIGIDININQLIQIAGPNIDNSNIIESDIVTTNFDKLGSDFKSFSDNLCNNKIIVNKYINQVDSNHLGGSNWDFDINGKSVSTQSDGKTIPLIVTPGVDYSVIETSVRSNYTFDKAVCVNQDNRPLGNSTINKRVEAINLQPREVAVCNFINLGPTIEPTIQPTNTPLPGITYPPDVTPIPAADNPDLSTKQCGLNIGLIFTPEQCGPPGPPGPVLPRFVAPSQSNQSIKDVYISVVDGLADYPVQFSLIGYDDSIPPAGYYFKIIQPLTSDTDLFKNKINSYNYNYCMKPINLQDGIIKARASFFPRINNGLIISDSNGAGFISNQNYEPESAYEYSRVINDTIIETNATKKAPYNIKLINLIPAEENYYGSGDLEKIFGNNVNDTNILNSDIVSESIQSGSLALFVSQLKEFVKNRCDNTITVNKYIKSISPDNHGGSKWQYTVDNDTNYTNDYGQTDTFPINPGQSYSVTEDNIKTNYNLSSALCYNQYNQNVGTFNNPSVDNITANDKDVITCDFVNKGPTLTPMPPIPTLFPCLPVPPEDVPNSNGEYTKSFKYVKVYNWVNTESSKLKLNSFTTITCDQDITNLKLTEIDFDDLRQQGIDLDCASMTKTPINIYPRPINHTFSSYYEVKINYKLNARALCYQAEFVDVDNKTSKSTFKCYTGSDNLCFIKYIKDFAFLSNDIRSVASVSNNIKSNQSQKPNLIQKIIQGIFGLFK